VHVIEHARRIPQGSAIRADVCIAGAGAAGITLAHELADSGLSVVLLVGGGRREGERDRDLYRGSADPPGSHEPLEQNRRRGWGGTTARWGGRCLPLDPVDFEERAHVPHSGWPVTYEDLLPHFARANVLCEAGRFTYDVADALPGAQRELIVGFDGPDVVTTRLERWSPPTHFGKRYEHVLRKAPGIRVLMGASALHLQLTPDGSRVSSLRAASHAGLPFEVRSREYVLACGGLENARLLLASDDITPSGVGNLCGNVGRYYMSHVTDIVATVQLHDPNRFVFGFERDAGGVYVRRRLWATPHAQRRYGMGNVAAVFHRPELANPAHGSGLFSSAYLAKSYVQAFRTNGLQGGLRALRADGQGRADHWRVLGENLPSLLPASVELVRDRWLSRRRLPMVLGQKTGDRFDLLVSSEHAPHPESRVSLSHDRDAFGVRRLSVHPAYSDLDVETVVRFFGLVGAQLAESETGSLRTDLEHIRRDAHGRLDQFNSFAHHLGTTRMSSAPGSGVVDGDCKVHGVENLFLSGGSVFATSGHANPTLTIVALAARLAEHLRRLPRARAPEFPSTEQP